jgi:hypothetical protein
MSRSTYGFCHGDRRAVLTSRIPGDWTRLEHDPVDRIAVAQRKLSWGGLPGERLHEFWAVHWAVGASVTLQWATRRRSCARTTKTNNTLNITVGTVKKSTRPGFGDGYRGNVRHICDGGVLRRQVLGHRRLRDLDAQFLQLPCVQSNADVFSGRQSRRGKSQQPRSLDGRVKGNRCSGAHRRSSREEGERVPGPQRE